MIYCKKCSRLIEDKDTECPYCGEKTQGELDASGVGPEDNTLESQFHKLNSLTEKSGTSVEREYNDVNRRIEDSRMQPPLPIPYSEQQGYSYSNPSEPVGDVDYSAVAKVMYLILSIVLSPVGIIVALVIMNGSSKKRKTFGQTMLMVSIIQIAIVLLCCCAAIGISLAGGLQFLEEYQYELQELQNGSYSW